MVLDGEVITFSRYGDDRRKSVTKELVTASGKKIRSLTQTTKMPTPSLLPAKRINLLSRQPNSPSGYVERYSESVSRRSKILSDSEGARQ